MRATVYAVHLDGRFTAYTGDFRQFAFRLMPTGGLVVPGDTISWDDPLPLMLAPIRNLTQRTRFDVEVIDGVGSPRFGASG
jgi:hypothetical protein